MPTISIGQARIAYEDTGAPPGRPDAPAVLFGHGLLFGGWMFRAQVAALRERYRCLTIDWRGQGDSVGDAGGYDAGGYGMDTLTADAVALVDALGLGPVHWVGLSMGGFVGLRIAARHGELLRSLTLLGSSAEPEAAANAATYRRLAWVMRLVGFRPVAGRVSQVMFAPAFRTAPAGRELVGEWVRRLGDGDRSALRGAVLGVVDRAGVDDELAAIAVPTLVMVGADDRATPPEHARRLAAAIPGARLRVLDACGHSSALERPDAVTASLTDFLAEVDGA